MFKKLVLIGLVALSVTGAVQAKTVADPVGDFLPSYTGPHQADLDVTSFSVTYDDALEQYHIQSSMAGTIDPSLAGFYAIGVNTGSATAPGVFASIGEPNVIFNKVIVVQKNGTAAISGVAVPGGVSISGNTFSLIVPFAMLPSTGFADDDYGWNIWPRSGPTGGLAAISDFAPDNATITSAPEPETWALLATGFGCVGVTLRRRKKTPMILT